MSDLATCFSKKIDPGRALELKEKKMLENVWVCSHFYHLWDTPISLYSHDEGKINQDNKLLLFLATQIIKYIVPYFHDVKERVKANWGASGISWLCNLDKWFLLFLLCFYICETDS